LQVIICAGINLQSLVLGDGFAALQKACVPDLLLIIGYVLLHLCKIIKMFALDSQIIQ
jgi:hypothetical protein